MKRVSKSEESEQELVRGGHPMAWSVDSFPPSQDVETKTVLRLCARAHRYLAELKGASKAIPNQGILINTLALQEAKDSSAIENIITTHDELFKNATFPDLSTNLAAKEVRNYAVALRTGFDLVKNDRLITTRHTIAIQETIEHNKAGLRQLSGTEIRNDTTGETVYIPPQHPDQIVALMSGLERFINQNGASTLDPLVKMALIHHQFESIHPFYDGNGRTGRIINVLYLVKEGLLDIPVLYLSRYLIRTKAQYYAQLQAVRQTGDWEPWLVYLLQGLEKTARFTLSQVQAIKVALQDYKHRIRTDLKNIYSQDLINNLFIHPYTKIEFVEHDLGVSRITATRYLQALADGGFVTKQKIGKSNYYINRILYPILTREDEL